MSLKKQMKDAEIKKVSRVLGRLVDRQGFEPQLKAPKTSVLPLHHRSVSERKNKYFFQKNKNILPQKY